MSILLMLAVGTPLAALMERPRPFTYRKRMSHIETKGAYSYHPARA